MRTYCRKLKKSEKLLLEGLAIITAGSLEILIDHKPIRVLMHGDKAGYELLHCQDHMIELRALEESVITVLPLSDLKELYKVNEHVRRFADKRLREIMAEYCELITSREHYTLEQILERLLNSARGHYCILNVSQLCREWGYSRQQFHKAIKHLETKGVHYEKTTKCLVREVRE